MAKPNGRPSTGVGLANVAKRLTVVYQDKGMLDLAPRAAGGTCATILVPRLSGGVDA